MAAPLLEATSITKSFAGVQALKDVSFELLEGEVHALIGENGAGKIHADQDHDRRDRADSGTLEVRGRTVPHNDPSIARSLGIAAIYQQPSLFPHLTRRREYRIDARNRRRVADRWTGRSAIAGLSS